MSDQMNVLRDAADVANAHGTSDEALVERIGQALAGQVRWGYLTVATRDAYRQDARRVLAAIRETHVVKPHWLWDTVMTYVTYATLEKPFPLTPEEWGTGT